MRFSFTLSCALALIATSQATLVRRVFTPSPSPDGTSLLFAWQGDIWKAGIDGSHPIRLTVNPAVESNPHWTPDGKTIVFNSNRFGNDDVFTMDSEGHNITRLTFDSAPERLYSVDDTYAWCYSSLWGSSNILRVPLKGGEILRMTHHPLETSYHPFPVPGGKEFVFVGGGRSGNWTQGTYKGVGSGEIWIANNTVPATNYRRLTVNEANDFFPMVQGGKIYFTSNRTGHPNLWSMDLNGKNAKQLTFHTIGTVRYPSIGSHFIAYEQDSDIWLYDLTTGSNKKLQFDLPDDASQSQVREITVNSGQQGFATSADGKRMAMILRGDVFLLPEKGGVMRRIGAPLSRVEFVQWLDAKTVLYTSRRNGKSELYKSDLQGKETLFLSDAQDITAPDVSPDGKWVSFARGNRELCIVPAAGGAVKVICNAPFPGGLQGSGVANWSPDSKWLVFNNDKTRSAEVTVYNIEKGTSIPVGEIARGASVPGFTSNGKAVYVESSENELNNLYQIDLSPAEVTFSEDELDQDEKPKKPDNSTKVEPKGILQRIRLIAKDVSGAAPGPDPRSYYVNVNGQLSVVSATATNPVPGVKGTAGVAITGGKTYFVQAGGILKPGETGPTPLAYSTTMSVDNRAEEKALFDDACWALSRMYYDPTLHGRDLEALRKRYLDIIPHTTSRADFYALMGEFVEEFDSSHMGATGPVDRGALADADQTGWLSIDFDWSKVATGHYVVSKVTVDGAGSRAGIAVGDEIKSINGQHLGAHTWAELLRNTVGKKVSLGVSRAGKDLTLSARPASELVKTNEFYEEYVAWTREQIEKLSGGKLTYMHIRAMDEPSYQKFLQEIRTLTNDKKGVIVDVRFNGGGSTSHKLLGILVKQTWLLRDTRATNREKISENIYRGDALELPTALMTNGFSFSNAEIMSEGFRRLKRGPIIGEKTSGSVIGTGAFPLFDGGMIRMPSIGCYDVDGKELEHEGRAPDVTVSFDPNLWLVGRDAQLEAAVKELMKKIK